MTDIVRVSTVLLALIVPSAACGWFFTKLIAIGDSWGARLVLWGWLLAPLPLLVLLVRLSQPLGISLGFVLMTELGSAAVLAGLGLRRRWWQGWRRVGVGALGLAYLCIWAWLMTWVLFSSDLGFRLSRIGLSRQ